MAGHQLTQAEADALIAMEKHRITDEACLYPEHGSKLKIPLQSSDHREKFFLTVNRTSIVVENRSYQTLGRQVVELVRLDLGKPHTNPDGRFVPAPHLHRYREGWGAKWAEPVSVEAFPHVADPWLALVQDFMRYCNITQPPKIERGLWT